MACSIIDISKVCSDAATVVSTAYTYHASSSDQPLYRVFIPPESATESNESHSSNVPEIAVILNITPGDWKFIAHRASIQRIIMNLVGNSLKYTHSGFVKIDLSLDDPHSSEDSHPRAEPSTSIVKLIVSDSGKGISSQFLETKLFSAFSQESTLAPGTGKSLYIRSFRLTSDITGLGLHIVKSLVQLQQGTIEIKSKVHKGTNVIVKLPVQRPSASSTHPASEDVLVRNRDDEKISTARQAVQNKKFAFQGFKGTTGKLVLDSLRDYLVRWFDMRSTSEEAAEVIITDGERLNECLSSISRLLHRPKLIVFCEQSRQQLILQTQNRFDTKFEFLTSPFGPHKLSKVLLACFKHVELQNGFHTRDSSGTESSLEEVKDSNSILTNGLLPKIQNIVRQVSPPTVAAESFPIRAMTPPNLLQTQTRPRILCVDDNAINLRLLKTYMDKLRFKDVTIAENGKVAFEVVRRRIEGFDLIFMGGSSPTLSPYPLTIPDLSMPICDGFQCSSLIRTLEKMQLKVTPPDTPPPKPALIVALTGLASESDQDAAMAVGIDHFLTKPLKLSRLKELMVEWGVMSR
jgi:CheY-like chemotaxis protein